MLDPGTYARTETPTRGRDAGEEAKGFTVAAPSLTLPKGGGAIRGIGEKFSVNPATGTGSLTVPIATSTGRAGFSPQLSLGYDSAAGNGPFGLGWNLSLPAITRKTDKGVPQYLDAEESDVFVLSGAEDLVPVLVRGALDGWEREPVPDRTVDHVRYRISRYRPRVEGVFARIERWTNVADPGDTFWRSISRDNIMSWYGRTAESRVADPADRSRIFSWLVCESHDDKGNVICYGYKPEDSARIFEDANGNAVSLAHERNRSAASRGARRYPKRIRYGNRQPYYPVLEEGAIWPAPPGAAAADGSDTWHFELVFDYGEHDAAAPLPGDAGTWPARSDPFSYSRAGFELRTYRLCRRVLMFHHFPAEQDVGRNCLVRSTEFSYSAPAEPAVVDRPVYTFLRSVTQAGHRRAAGGGYLRRSLPPLDFVYTHPVVQDAIESIDPQGLENLPAGLDSSLYLWIDLHGEGVPGILTEQAGAWFYKRNLSPLAPVRGRFGPVEAVAQRPNVALAGGAELIDVRGDGVADVVVMEGAAPGFHEHDEAEGWQPFRPFQGVLERDLRDPNLRFLDLDGDGRADVLITEEEALVWHASLAEQGFAAARRVAQALNEEQGPRIAFADGTQAIYLADLSGDGLADIVRIRNGEACYWPNLGHGRFGAKVAMDNAPWFDHQDQFDQRRIRLADIDGSGTADLVYLHRDGVRLYFNQSGNAWSQPVQLAAVPHSADPTSILALDLLGNGTTCLVWSSPLAADAARPMRYLNLAGPHKPHLLVGVDNNLGAETRVQYAPSTKFYLQDRHDGHPWMTRLPFPVHVIERVESWDYVSRNRSVKRYAYHHGRFDGEEREFCGFGMVEEWQGEAVGALTGRGLPAANFDAASDVPEVHTRTWYHTGAYLRGPHVSDFFAGLLDEGDAGEYFREPGLTDAQARALLLPDTQLPAGLSPAEEREACRALKGAMLRQEVYADDAGADAPAPLRARARTPYTVSEQTFGIRCLQPRGGNRHAVFFTHIGETVRYHYERQAADPRIEHALALELDPYGNVLKQAAVGYGRREQLRVPTAAGGVQQVPNPALAALAPADRARQLTPLITYTETSLTNPVVSRDAWRTPLPCESATFELTGYVATGQGGRYCAQDLVEDDPTAPGRLRHRFAAPEVPYEAAASGSQRRRCIDRVRTLYRSDDLGSLLPLGQLQSLAIAGESYKLAFTPGLLAAVFQRPRTGSTPEPLLPDPAAVLGGAGASGGGYLQSQALRAGGWFPAADPDEHWWIGSGLSFFSADPADTAAAELAQARAHFFRPRRYLDAFGQHAFADFDGYDLLLRATRDALDNRLTVEVNDYRVLQPCRIADANRNRTEVAFDALGFVVGTAAMGKALPAPQEGDSLQGFDADPDAAKVAAFFADPLARAPALLHDASTRVVYDVDRFARSRQAQPAQPQAWQPACAATLARETHASAPPPPGGTRIQLAFSYSDGFGREIQNKLRAEPGPLDPDDPQAAWVDPRWVGSGWTVFNNKGLPVRRYEPFFSASSGFEYGLAAGVSAILFYDPADRMVATLQPNRSYEKVVFDAWQQTRYDVNDTCAPRARPPGDPRPPQTGDPRTDPDIAGYVAGYFAAQPPTWLTWRDERIAGLLGAHEREAALRAEPHADTPTTVHLDALGRPFLTVTRNRVACPGHDLDGTEESLAARVEIDIEGNQRAVRDAVQQDGDPLGRVVMRFAHDLLGNRIHQSSMEAGARWILADVAGKPIRAWDSRGHVFTSSYDALRRPLEQAVRGTSGESDPRTLTRDVVVDRIEYGEGVPGAEALNLRTRVYRHFDAAGVATNARLDARGVPVEAYDFKGNLLRSTRRLASDYTALPDWSLAPQLEAESFASATRYDALNRPVQSIAPHSDLPHARRHVIQPVFNAANLLERVDVWLERASEPAGLLDPVAQSPSRAGIANIDYDASGRRLRVEYRNGATTTLRHDPLTFRLARLVTQRPANLFPDDDPQPPVAGWPGRQVQSLHYTYDPAGNVVHLHDDAQQTIHFRQQRVEPGSDYTYDALYRLLQATGREHLGQGAGGDRLPPSAPGAIDAFHMRRDHPGDGNAMGRYVERYVYDAVGNLVQMQHRGSQPGHAGWTRAYERLERSLLENGPPPGPMKTSNRLTRTVLHPAASAPQPEAYGHDAHGNMVRMPHLGGGLPGPNMHWDYRDQLRQVDLGGGGVAFHVHDATGRRVRKVWEKAAGLTEDRIYLGGFEIFRRHTASSSGAGVAFERETLHVMDDRHRIALVETRTVAPARDDPAPRQAVRYQIDNHLGSVSLELDEDAHVVSYEEYAPYGSTTYQAVRSQTETARRYRFSGKERDEETGFDDFGGRSFVPWLGCWASCDPAGIGDALSLYVFCASDPVNHVDPGGREIRYFQILFLGVEPTDEELAEYNANPTAHNVAFAGAFVGVAGLAAAAAVATIPAAVSAGAATVKSIAAAGSVKAMVVVAALNGETVVDLGNVAVATYDVAVTGAQPGSLVGLQAAVADLATGPNVVGDVNSARVLSKPRSGGGRPQVDSGGGDVDLPVSKSGGNRTPDLPDQGGSSQPALAPRQGGSKSQAHKPKKGGGGKGGGKGGDDGDTPPRSLKGDVGAIHGVDQYRGGQTMLTAELELPNGQRVLVAIPNEGAGWRPEQRNKAIELGYTPLDPPAPGSRIHAEGGLQHHLTDTGGPYRGATVVRWAISRGRGGNSVVCNEGCKNFTRNWGIQEGKDD